MINSIFRSIIINALEKEAEKRGKTMSWFRYAVKTKTGAWRFLTHKEAQVNVLEQVAKGLKGKLSGMTEGEIADEIAEIVNSAA